MGELFSQGEDIYHKLKEPIDLALFDLVPMNRVNVDNGNMASMEKEDDGFDEYEFNEEDLFSQILLLMKHENKCNFKNDFGLNFINQGQFTRFYVREPLE